MIRTAIVLQARMASRRLPGKALADVSGRTVLAHCIERLKVAGLPVVLATTTRPEDDCLEEAGERLGVAVVRGASDDVLGRFVQVASTFGLTHLIRATCDNPGVDIDAPGRTLAVLLRTEADYVGEVGLPCGAAVEAVSAKGLFRAAELASEPYDREHVTPFVRRDGRFRLQWVLAPERLRRPDLRISVDTAEDLDFVRRVFTRSEAACRRPVGLAELMTAAAILCPGGGVGASDARGLL